MLRLLNPMRMRRGPLCLLRGHEGEGRGVHNVFLMTRRGPVKSRSVTKNRASERNVAI